MRCSYYKFFHSTIAIEVADIQLFFKRGAYLCGNCVCREYFINRAFTRYTFTISNSPKIIVTVLFLRKENIYVIYLSSSIPMGGNILFVGEKLNMHLLSKLKNLANKAKKVTT